MEKFTKNNNNIYKDSVECYNIIVEIKEKGGKKMKKSSKGLILLGTAAIAIGMGGTSQLTTQINRNVQKENIQTYNHNPANILDNIFIENNKKILPFIFDDAQKKVSADEIKKEFKNAGLTVKTISTSHIGTGTTITVEENNDVYTVLVYGDANGNGVVNLIDAQKIIVDYLNAGAPQTVKDIYGKAANVNNPDNSQEVNLIDAQRIIAFYLKMPLSGNKLVVNEPASIKDAPVIKLNGSNPQIVKYGANYTDAGATATDKTGATVTVETSGKIETTTLGEQYITYTAKDSTGNTAIATRKVIVKDYATKVEVTKEPKTEYKEGEALDLTGGEITITYASKKSETISMNKCTASGYSSTVGSKTITLTYENENLFEPATVTYTVNVTSGSVNPPDPITVEGIRLDYSAVRTNYAQGDTISANGLKVYAKNSNNTETLLDLADVKLEYSDTTALVDKTVTITVTYDTKDGTFTEKFDIAITVSKPVSTIITAPNDVSKVGIKHESIEITLSSGDGEADLEAGAMDKIVKKDGKELAEGTDIVSVEFKQNGSKVTMTFKATQTGEYEVTPKLGNIIGTPITVSITNENLTITDIEFNIPDTTKFIAGKDIVTVPISFKHKYEGTTDEDEVTVEARELFSKITADAGLEIELWRGTQGGPGSKIENPETSTEIVEYIGIKAANANSYNLSIAIGSANISETIVVEPVKIEINADITNLPLYMEVPTDANNVIVDEDVPFTLIEISLQENGTEIEIEQDKLTIQLRDTTGGLTDIDNELYHKLYKENRIEAIDGKDIKYIGITAFGSEDVLNAVNGKEVVISYDGAEKEIVLKIEAVMPEKTVKTITPDVLSKSGAKHEEIAINLSSGQGEADLKADAMEKVIKKDGKELAENTDIASVEFKQNGSKVTMTFKATQIGEYEVTPKLGDVVGASVTISITNENLTVTDIEFNIPDTTKFIAGKDTVVIPISFKHKYDAVADEDEINVKAQDLYNKITVDSGLEIELWKDSQGGPGTKIENPETSTEFVKYIGIKAANANTYNLSIEIDGARISKTIIVEEAKLELKVDITNLPLYMEVPTDATNVITDEGVPFTLIGISLQENGTEVEIDGNKLTIQLRDTTGGLVDIDDELYHKLYKADKTEASDLKDIKYIGITAFGFEETLDAVDGREVVISYEGVEQPINLTIVANK